MARQARRDRIETDKRVDPDKAEFDKRQKDVQDAREAQEAAAKRATAPPAREPGRPARKRVQKRPAK